MNLKKRILSLALACALLVGLLVVPAGASGSSDESTQRADQLASLVPLPESLDAAIRLARQSELIAGCLPKATIDTYLTQKEAEWAAYHAAPDKAAYDAAHEPF